MTSFPTKLDLVAGLGDSNQIVLRWFSAVPSQNFFTRQGETWSASDNLDHLIKSHKPFAKALKLPKLTLRAMFGRPEQPSRSYEAICQTYRETLADGGVASGRYLPDQQHPGNAEEAKSGLIAQFDKASAELASLVENLSEADLDGYLLPHPLLGKLTLREMVYFTVYHNLRHASHEGD